MRLKPRKHEQQARLSDCNITVQSYVLAQITRNQYSLDYWIGALSELPNKPWYRYQVKQLYNQIMREYTFYNSECQQLFTPTENFDAHEILLDNASEFHTELKQTVGYYEQAMSRLMQAKGIDDAPFMMKMATAKDLLEVSAFAQGQEASASPQVRGLCKMGGHITELPFMPEDRPDMKCLPSVMGHFTRLCSQMNILILQAQGRDYRTFRTCEATEDISRSIEICTNKIINLFTNYQLICTMYENMGRTMSEAKQVVKKRIEKAEHKEQIKQAKANIKNQTK